MLKLLKPANPEDLFVQRYDLLMGWALSLTAHNHALAEDLVHDAFIQFTLRRRELGAIENTDAYLHRMLRNMHLSHVRRAALIQDSRFSITNFDSAEMGLRSVDPREDVTVQDELRLICQYACIRKETSKAGSVLILRFFHGYYPSEIARIMRTTRTAVDRWLALARREAKTYLADPSALRFTTENLPSTKGERGYARTTVELVNELRKRVFDSRQSDCLSVEQLKDLYRAKPSVDSADLAHIVSCPSCLDAVNRLLDLPLLTQRDSDDRLGRDRDVPPDSSGGGEAGGGGALVESKRRYKRRFKEMIEHRPQELRIAVNGFVLGAQQVSSEFNKQALTVNVDEPIGFIEVFSEQGVRLLFFDVDQPSDGNIEQKATAEFDRGRRLDLGLSFRGPWPALTVAYQDPTFETVESLVESFESEGEGIPEVESRKSKVQGPRAKVSGLLAKLLTHLPDFRLWTLDFGLLLRPATVTALFALVLMVAAVLLNRPAPVSPPSAADLLQRTAAFEDSIASNRDQVLHRTLQLEEKSASGQLIATGRVGIWHSAEKGITVRRLYDESGSLVAGVWRRADGSQTIYHHSKRPGLKLAPDKLVKVPINFDTVWQLGPSAKDFARLIGNAQSARVEERPASYVISYSEETNADSSGVVRATLTLSRADLHAAEMTLLVSAEAVDENNRQSAISNRQLREYRLVEMSYERRPPSAVAPTVFEPEPALLGSDTETWRLGEKENIPASPRSPVSVSPALATPELELQVLSQLNQADAFYGEQIGLSRTPEGQLHIQGIVETEKRKGEILQALSFVKRNPAVQIQVETVTEAAERQARQRPSPSGPIEVGNVEVESKSTIPAEKELHAYFSRQRGLSGDALDQEIRRFADRVMTRTRQARRHALALKQIAERFSASDLHALDDTGRNQWRQMIARHASGVAQELEELRRELQPLFPSVSGGQVDTGLEISRDADLAPAAKRLFDLTYDLDKSVGTSFSIYAGTNASAPVRNAEFARALITATALAQRIARKSRP